MRIKWIELNTRCVVWCSVNIFHLLAFVVCRSLDVFAVNVCSFDRKRHELNFFSLFPILSCASTYAVVCVERKTNAYLLVFIVHVLFRTLFIRFEIECGMITKLNPCHEKYLQITQINQTHIHFVSIHRKYTHKYTHGHIWANKYSCPICWALSIFFRFCIALFQCESNVFGWFIQIY